MAGSFSSYVFGGPAPSAPLTISGTPYYLAMFNAAGNNVANSPLYTVAGMNLLIIRAPNATTAHAFINDNSQDSNSYSCYWADGNSELAYLDNEYFFRIVEETNNSAAWLGVDKTTFIPFIRLTDGVNSKTALIKNSNGLQITGVNIGFGGDSDNNFFKVIAGTITDQKSALYISATLPTVITGNTSALNIQITSAGSSAFATRGINCELLSGYTGSSQTASLRFINSVAGTGNDYFASTQLGNFGATGASNATTTGLNVGLNGSVLGGNISMGVAGRAITAKNSATNIGVAGFALNTGTTPIQIGGYFGLQNALPTFISAALIADNGSTTDLIFAARDNGTTKFKIIDGGSVICSDAALATTATDGFLYVPSCAGVPTGVPTAQTGTIPIVVDSTNNKMYIYSGGAWVALN